MPSRHACPNCGNAQRKGGACVRCGSPATPLEVPHTGAGAAMYVLAALGGVAILLAFFGLAYLVFVSFGLLGAALALNVVDDRRLDAAARTQATAMAAKAPRHPACGTALQFDPQRQRPFCPRCRAYV